MSHVKNPRLKPLLEKVPPGFLVDTRCLKAQGINDKSIHNYVKRGWLERMMRGVYRRPMPGEQPTSDTPWESTVLSLQWIMKYDVHLGGLSALELAGFSHYLQLGSPRIHLYGTVPTWLRRMPSEAKFLLHTRSLFGDSTVGITETHLDAFEAFSVWRWSLQHSTPERALLEALDDLNCEAGFDNLIQMFISMTTLRPELLMDLLISCKSIKVRRLFFVFAEASDHSWVKYLDTDKIDFGSGVRALVKGGRLHPKYNIYVPTELTASRGSGGIRYA